MKAKIIVTVLWTLLSGLLSIAFADVLEPEEALAQAVSDNPGLAEMRARYEALTEVAPQQSSLPDPVVSLNAMNFPWDDFDRLEWSS